MRLSRILILIPFVVTLIVWLSPLAFVPVPWPDDSAFYFVAKSFFHWPPRWVMLTQAPFEPTYRIFNFNTMPLYPMLIGLGRMIGIDGSFGLKFWPLGFWALSGSLLAYVLLWEGLPTLVATLLIFAFSLDPALRWASVLIRPESFVGFVGMLLVLGLTFGYPESLRRRKFWDPIAALLALGAYAHFNAVHLLFPVVFAYLEKRDFFKRLLNTGALTALYLSPWAVLVLLHFDLFTQQMHLQWSRLAVGNDWLSSPQKALSSVFQSMGSPEPFSPIIQWAAAGVWIMILAALFVVVVSLFLRFRKNYFGKITTAKDGGSRVKTGRLLSQNNFSGISLLPSAAWVLGSVWLWHTKPEVWFTYFIHLSIWCFAGIALLKLCYLKQNELSQAIWLGGNAIVAGMFVIFVIVDGIQFEKLARGSSWNWDTYNHFVDCVHAELKQESLRLRRPIQVWGPTFPDILIELSRREPNWEFTRTDDFWSRWDLGVRHGYAVDAVVVTETLGWRERDINAPAHFHPEIQSTWMTWKDYYLNRLWMDPHWKTNRYICQKGRWQAFIFMNATAPAVASPKGKRSIRSGYHRK